MAEHADNAPKGESEVIDAEMAVYRVFSVNREFKDRDGRKWVHEEGRGPQEGDRFHLTIGDLPDGFVNALRGHRAFGAFMLQTTFGGQDAGSTRMEREQAAAAAVPQYEAVRAELIRPGHTYLTLEVRRPVRVSAISGAVHLWLADADPLERLSTFGAEANEFLDIAAARLLPSLPDKLIPSDTVYRKPRAFLEASERMSLTKPSLKLSVSGILLGSDGWADLDFGQVQAGCALLGDGSDRYSGLARTPARWLWAALEEQTDKLRRFQFAFFGLEVLANKAGASLKSEIADALSEELNGLPIDTLMWPTPHEADSPWRSLTFHFALVAIHLNRENAAADIERFKILAKARNRLAHGQAEDLEDLPADDALNLLREYLGRLAAQA